MTPAVARVARVLTVVVFVAVVVVAYRTFNPPDPESVSEPRAGELNVANAINGPAGTVIVRGHVFDGPGGMGLRLCQGRKNSSPPACIGPFLDLDGVNEGSFSFKTSSTKDGPVKVGEDAVALRGVVDGTRMAVSEVLS